MTERRRQWSGVKVHSENIGGRAMAYNPVYHFYALFPVMDAP